jgi:methylmalonyl-CoA mutase N-terminal domain/subunit
MQREIASSAYRQEKDEQDGTKPIVATNLFVGDQEQPELAVHAPDSQVADRQIEILRGVRAARDEDETQRRLTALTEAARADTNLMPLLMACARADATLGEMVTALRTVFGDFVEPPL